MDTCCVSTSHTLIWLITCDFWIVYVQVFCVIVWTVLVSQVYTSHGPTVVMPTWFSSRNWFLKVGPFDEGGKVRVHTAVTLCLVFPSCASLPLLFHSKWQSPDIHPSLVRLHYPSKMLPGSRPLSDMFCDSNSCCCVHGLPQAEKK